jgi:hypothetical protein
VIQHDQPPNGPRGDVGSKDLVEGLAAALDCLECLVDDPVGRAAEARAKLQEARSHLESQGVASSTAPQGTGAPAAPASPARPAGATSPSRAAPATAGPTPPAARAGTSRPDDEARMTNEGGPPRR